MFFGQYSIVILPWRRHKYMFFNIFKHQSSVILSKNHKLYLFFGYHSVRVFQY